MPNPVARIPTQSPVHAPAAAQYSCLLCKQRKVRCDRKMPCSACVQWKAECVRTTRAPYTHRKRQRQRGTPGEIRRESTEQPASSSAQAAGQPHVPVLGECGGPVLANPSGLLFGGIVADIELESAHPQPVQTFVLWQTFLQNVNPLSKVIYAPQVQDLIVQAAVDFTAVPVQTVPLLFALYAAAVASWSEAECRAKMGEPKQALLQRYLASTQQALTAAGYLHTNSLVLLQGYTIYLLAARQVFDASSMWILTGIGLRMGSRLLTTTPNAANGSAVFETEMRRRVFWQMLLIDGRAAQLSGQGLHSVDVPAVPLPANLNDSDISPQMAAMPPAVTDRATEMLFCLMRYELCQFLLTHGRELHDPKTPMARRDRLIDNLAAMYERAYLGHVDAALPMHRIAATSTSAMLAKMRLTAHHPSRRPSMPQAEHDTLFATAVTMVETLLRGLDDESVAPFRWHADMCLQLDAVIFLLIESQSQAPEGTLVDTTWQLVADAFRHRPSLASGTDEISRAVRQLVLRAWEARERSACKGGLKVPNSTTLIADLRAQAQKTSIASAEEDIGADPNSSLYRSYADDWESWDYWNTLLQGETVVSR